MPQPRAGRGERGAPIRESLKTRVQEQALACWIKSTEVERFTEWFEVEINANVNEPSAACRFRRARRPTSHGSSDDVPALAAQDSGSRGGSRGRYLEEAVFRKLLMDRLATNRHGTALQVLSSSLAFGVAHGVWGLFGRSMKAAVGATAATGTLGLAMAYIVSGRTLAPCVAAHFLINAFVEPGLVLAATRGEMGQRSVVASR